VGLARKAWLRVGPVVSVRIVATAGVTLKSSSFLFWRVMLAFSWVLSVAVD
jgi:hypothetical protein